MYDMNTCFKNYNAIFYSSLALGDVKKCLYCVHKSLTNCATNKST